MTKIFLVAAATLLVAPCASQGVYVTSKDRAAARDSELAAEKMCEGISAEDTAADAAEAKANLQDALGGDNFLLTAMKESKDSDEFNERASTATSEKISSGAGSFFLAGLCWIGLWCCTCTAFPCFKNLMCCRPCSKLRDNTPVWKKGIAILPIALCFLMTVIGMATSSGGAGTMVDGFDNMGCESAKLLKNTLQGKTGQLSFIGLIPALEIMKDVEDVLGDNSNFMTQLNAKLDDTKQVSEAIAIASSTLATMKVTLEHAETAVQTAGTAATYRTCQFCTTLGGNLATAITALESGIGQALANARNEVNSQLTPEKRVELQGTVRTSAAPMVEMKDAFIESIGEFVDPEGNMLEPLSVIPQVVSLTFGGAFLVILCGCCSTGCWFKEKDPDGNFNKAPHRCACLSWFFALIFAMPLFIVGGLLSGVSLPLASICIIMDDINGDMLKEIGPSFDIDPTTAESKNLITMLDNCINPADPTLNANFLDLITIENATTGTSETMRAKLQTQVSAPINDQFAAISTGGSASLATSDGITTLINAVKDNPILDVMVVDGNTMGAQSDFSALVIAADTELKEGLAASLGCDAHTIQGQSTAIPGVKPFFDKMQTMGSVDGSLILSRCGTAWTLRNCAALTSNAAAECAATNKYLELYKKVITDVKFRCDVWEDAAGNECDVEGMNDATGVGSCLNNGAMKVKTKECDADQWATYYAKYETRIEKVMKYVDASVASKKSAIEVGLKDLVYQEMLNPLFSIFDGVNCGWLPGFWQATVNSLCYQGVYGMRRVGQGYMMSAFFVVLLAINMYAVWRYNIDNVNKSTEPPTGEAWNQEAAV